MKGMTEAANEIALALDNSGIKAEGKLKSMTNELCGDYPHLPKQALADAAKRAYWRIAKF